MGEFVTDLDDSYTHEDPYVLPPQPPAKSYIPSPIRAIASLPQRAHASPAECNVADTTSPSKTLPTIWQFKVGSCAAAGDDFLQSASSSMLKSNARRSRCSRKVVHARVGRSGQHDHRARASVTVPTKSFVRGTAAFPGYGGAPWMASWSAYYAVSAKDAMNASSPPASFQLCQSSSTGSAMMPTLAETSGDLGVLVAEATPDYEFTFTVQAPVGGEVM